MRGRRLLMVFSTDTFCTANCAASNRIALKRVVRTDSKVPQMRRINRQVEQGMVTPKGKTFDRIVKMVKMMRQMMMEMLELRFSWIKARSKSLVEMCCEVVLLSMGVLLSLSSSLSVARPCRGAGVRLVYCFIGSGSDVEVRGVRGR